MSKNLRTLHNQLRNQGYTLLTALSNAYQPGTMVHERSWKSLPLLGSLKSILPKDSFPAVEGPRAVVLEGFTRTHGLDVKAAFEWMGDDVKANGTLKNVVQVTGRFEAPVARWVDLLALSSMVSEHVGSNATLKGFLKRQSHRLVAQVVEARLSFHFEKDGGIGAAVDGSIPGASVKIGANAGFQWKNEATIESKKPIVVAVQLADWHKGRKIFVANM